MRHFLKISLPIILLAILMSISFDAQAKKKKQTRTVYYIVCGSHSTLNEAIKHSEQISEVMFYPVYKATANGKTVYRLCCQCYYSKADAEKDLEGFLSSFKGDDWWIWSSKGLAKCEYRPLSPKGDGERIPALQPLSKPITE